MKVIAAYKEHDLSSLSKIEDPIVLYSNDKSVYNEAIKIRGNYTTHAIYDKAMKSPYQVIVDYSEVLHDNGADNLVVHLLPQKYNYILYVMAILVILLVIILVLCFIFSVKKGYKNISSGNKSIPSGNSTLSTESSSNVSEK